MKFLISLLVLVQLTALQAYAVEKKDSVIKVIKQSTENSTLSIDDKTFVFNVNGYGCQWPGIRVLSLVVAPELNHNKFGSHFGSDADYMAIGIKNPNFQFCHQFGDVLTVFGKEFVVGAELPIKIHHLLDLRKGERFDNDGKVITVKFIQETITVSINGREVETTATVDLENK